MADEDFPDLTPDELRALKTQYNRAKEVLEKINALSIRYDAAYKAFETRTIDVDKVSVEVREKALAVETTRSESVNLVSEIKANLEKIQSTISQVDEAAIRFEGIKGRIEGKEGEMEALLSTARSLKEDVEKAKTDAQQKLVEIDAQFSKVQEKITQMQKAHEAFIGVHAKITDPNTGLQAILDQSVELQKQSNTTLAGIVSFHEQSKKALDQIKLNKSETDKIKAEAVISLGDINSNKSEVQKITALITDTGFANAFQKRERMLRVSAAVWLVIMVGALAGLAYYLHTSFLNIQEVPDWKVILYRITLTSPVLLLIGVAIRQYSVERGLNEKYAFKATIAAVIRHHSDFLINLKEKSSLEDSLFMREALKRVYVEPYKNEDISEDLIKKEVEQVPGTTGSQKKSRIAEILESAKEVKELIPDEALLKSLIELLVKYR